MALKTGLIMNFYSIDFFKVTLYPKKTYHVLKGTLQRSDCVLSSNLCPLVSPDKNIFVLSIYLFLYEGTFVTCDLTVIEGQQTA